MAETMVNSFMPEKIIPCEPFRTKQHANCPGYGRRIIKRTERIQVGLELVFLQLLSDILGKAGTEQNRLLRIGKGKRGFRDGDAGIKFHIVNVFLRNDGCFSTFGFYSCSNQSVHIRGCL